MLVKMSNKRLLSAAEIEAQAVELQRKRKMQNEEITDDRAIVSGRQPFAKAGQFDTDIYGSNRRSDMYDTSIAADDDDDDIADALLKHRLSTYAAQAKFVNEVARGSVDETEDMLNKARMRKIGERESEYQRKGRRHMQLSPERFDPFADVDSAPDTSARTYATIMRERQLAEEKRAVYRELSDVSTSGGTLRTNTDATASKSKRSRWEEKTPKMTNVPSHSANRRQENTPRPPTWRRQTYRFGGMGRQRK